MDRNQCSGHVPARSAPWAEAQPTALPWGVPGGGVVDEVAIESNMKFP